MIDIEIANTYIKLLVEDNDFDGKKFEMVVEMSGPLKYVNNDFEREVKIRNIVILKAELNGERLEIDVLKAIAEYIGDNLCTIITICTDGKISLDKDGLLDAAYEALEEFNLVGR